ncbi:ROK family protein [Nocardia bovistercoris]|uniref:ROK family protein n=1 Tax=Nocardia bovistercoris TaxID=2785916 RepID=A0A931IIK9_9NOCA|nr:ROK family protein [Nocardia bovistercoris]MBH0781006.1 ROK family protein [Nocardia bovistercoris]
MSKRREDRPAPPRRRHTWLGVDIGGTKTALRAHTDGGAVRDRVFHWTVGGVDTDLAQLSREVDLLRGEISAEFDAVGVGLPATIDSIGVVSAWPNRPEWVGLDVHRAFGALFGGAPIRFADDGDLAAMAEAEACGGARLLYVGVGTGVGGGMVVGGEYVGSTDTGSFEIGHLITDADGPDCRCGRRGCLQACASGPAILARAGRLRGAPVTFAELRSGLLGDEPWAVRAMDRACHRLAVAITGVNELLHPDVVVVGGGVAAGLPRFVATIDAHARALARPGVSSTPPIRGSRFGELSTLYGAVALARLLIRS